MEDFELSTAVRDHEIRKGARGNQSGNHSKHDLHVRTRSLPFTLILAGHRLENIPSFPIPILMPSPSPGVNASSSSGNGTPKLLNDYVRPQAPLLRDFAHGSYLSNSAIVSGKVPLVRFTVSSPNFYKLTIAPSPAPRCPQLGHRGDRCRKGDYAGKYTKGRDIPNHGI